MDCSRQYNTLYCRVLCSTVKHLIKKKFLIITLTIYPFEMCGIFQYHFFLKWCTWFQLFQYLSLYKGYFIRQIQFSQSICSEVPIPEYMPYAGTLWLIDWTFIRTFICYKVNLTKKSNKKEIISDDYDKVDKKDI